MGQNFNTNKFTIGPWMCSMGLFLRKGGNITGIIANVMGAFRAKYRPLLLSRGEYVPTGTLRDNDIWSYVKKKYKLNVPNFHVPAGQVSLQEPQQILPLLSDILLRTD